MAKFLRVCVTRTESTELYISVPDDFDKADLMGDKAAAWALKVIEKASVTNG